MSDHPELRIELSPDLSSPGCWSVRVIDSSSGGTVVAAPVWPRLTQDDLQPLRRRNWSSNVGLLRSIGTKIWETVMNGPIGEEFERIRMQQQHRPWRLVFVVRSSGGAGGGVRLADVPFEGLCQPSDNRFVALRMPVSRAVHAQPDRDAASVPLPLRVLVVIATPKDRSDAEAANERAAIARALAGKSDIQLEFCEKATFRTMRAALQKHQPHVLHFIGHGGFDAVDGDPTPLPYICLEDGTERAETKFLFPEGLIALVAEGKETRLVVMTACSTATAQDKAGEQGDTGLALDGMAQMLVQDDRINAAVAMQFDLEAWAATEFSREFYTRLLEPDCSLDEAVRKGRTAMFKVGSEGDRAWMTPVVYWRCRSGRVFSFAGHGSPDLPAIETQAKAHRDILLQMWAEPRVDLLRTVIEAEIARLHQLGGERAQKVRNALRLVGGFHAPTGEISCSVRLQLDVASTVNAVELELAHPDLELVRVERGADAVREPIAAATPAGTSKLVIVRPGGGEPSSPIEREIMRVVLRLAQGVPRALAELRPEHVLVQRDGNLVPCHAIPGWAGFL